MESPGERADAVVRGYAGIGAANTASDGHAACLEHLAPGSAGDLTACLVEWTGADGAGAYLCAVAYGSTVTRFSTVTRLGTVTRLSTIGRSRAVSAGS